MGKAGTGLDELAEKSSAKTKSPRSNLLETDIETTETEETEDETSTTTPRKQPADTRSTCSALSRSTTCSARSRTSKKARAAPIASGSAAYGSLSPEQLKELLIQKDEELAVNDSRLFLTIISYQYSIYDVGETD